MDRAAVQYLCHEASMATAKVRDVFRQRIARPDILDRFWSVQDHLARLVDAASDHPEKVFDVLNQEYSHLLRDIIDVLVFAASTRIAHNAAVTASCESINELLMRLERLKPLQAGAAIA